MTKVFTQSLAGLLLLMTASGAMAADELDDLLQGFDEPAANQTAGQAADKAADNAGNDLSDLDESGFDEPAAAAGMPDELDMSGFEDAPPPATAGSETAPAWYTLSGYASLLGAWNYAQSAQSVVAPGDQAMDFSGLSRARVKGGLTLEMKHATLDEMLPGDHWQSRFEIMAWHDASWALNDRSGYTQDVLDAYENFFDLKDAYIQGSLSSSLDLKFGRQIVIWGKSDSIRITDIINPLDNREPGMVDIEDLRLNELMTRFDYYFSGSLSDWSLSTIIIHEPRLDIEPAFGSDYRPSNVFGAPIPYSKFPDRRDPNWNLDNTQYALSMDGRFTGWDLSLYAANVFDNRFAVEIVDGAPVRYQDKINMLGLAGNWVQGSWLLKAEAAFIHDINYRSTARKNRLDMLIGFDYNGIRDTVLSLELANRHIFAYEDHMLTLTLQEAATQNTFPDFVRRDSMQLALRGSYSFDHDNATANYLLSLSGGNGPGSHFDGGFQRLWLDYKLNDDISLSTGIVDYIGGNGIIPFFEAIKNNDRIFVEGRYNF